MLGHVLMRLLHHLPLVPSLPPHLSFCVCSVTKVRLGRPRRSSTENAEDITPVAAVAATTAATSAFPTCTPAAPRDRTDRRERRGSAYKESTPAPVEWFEQTEGDAWVDGAAGAGA